MARKSASLGAVAAPIVPRPEPPAELSPDERDLWRSIVATKPAEWFSRDMYPLLVQYCRHRTRATQVARMIEASPEDGGDLKALFAMEAEQSHALASLATKMRLTQQSRYSPGRAATHSRSAGSRQPPWKFGEED
jgi:hypothetical protein